MIQTTDADGRTMQFLYDPLNRQVEEEWLAPLPPGESPLPPGEGQGEGVVDPVIHTIQTYYDADGETLGVTETDTNNPANCTDYEYTYNADGNVLTSRMAPGGLAQTPQTVDTYTTDTLSTSSPTADWNNGPAAEPYQGYSIALTAGEVVTVALVSSAFQPVAFAQCPAAAPPIGSSTRAGWAAVTPGCYCSPSARARPGRRSGPLPLRRCFWHKRLRSFVISANWWAQNEGNAVLQGGPSLASRWGGREDRDLFSRNIVCAVRLP